MSSFTTSLVTEYFPSATEREYEAGQIIVYNGDRPRHVIFVISGAYKFHDVDVNGNEKILHIGGPQSFFPLFYSFEDKPFVDGFYTTLSKSRFLFIPIEEFNDILKTDSAFTYRLLGWYVGEVDHIVLRLKSLEKSSAKHKLLQALTYLCGQHSVIRSIQPDWCRVKFNISQQTLAELTGLTRETVNLTLKDMEERGLVRMPRKLTLEINKTKLDALLAEM